MKDERTRLFLFYLCSSVPHLWLAFLCLLCATASAQFTVHTDQPVSPPLVGFGAQLNPYLYCTPNWGVINDENVKEYERKVTDLAPQHVRVFFMNEWFNPAATDPVAKSDRRIKDSFLRTLRLAQ